MINGESLKAVSASYIDTNRVKPLYDSYCFSRIPDTIYNLLTGADAPTLPMSVLGGLPTRYDKVVLLFVDAFGWRFFEQYGDAYPFIRRFVEQGMVSKMTSQFPSTTAVHYTTIQTGLNVGGHGIVDMAYYEPLVDEIISPLYFPYGEISPAALFPNTTVYHRLAEQGVRSYVFQDRDTLSDFLAAGAHRITPQRTLSEGLTNLGDAILNESGKAYYFLYFGLLDTLAHIYGPGSRQLAAEIDTCFTAMERLLHPVLDGQAKNTLLLVTADHGQTEISPETTLYLDTIAPEVMSLLKVNQRGERLPPGGSPRDLLLYVRPECLDEAYGLLVERFDGRAEVRYMRDMIAQGYYGATVSDTFLSRAADLVILPHDHESLWWTEEGRYQQPFYGFHGGLSANEMEIPLLALAY